MSLNLASQSLTFPVFVQPPPFHLFFKFIKTKQNYSRMARRKIKYNLKFLSHSRHNSNAQYPHRASGNHIGVNADIQYFHHQRKFYQTMLL